MISRFWKGHKVTFIVSSVLTCMYIVVLGQRLKKVWWFGPILSFMPPQRWVYMNRVVLYQCT